MAAAISSGTITVPYHRVTFKYSYKINSYTWENVFKVGLTTDMFVLPYDSGRNFDAIRVVFGEDGVLYSTQIRGATTFTSGDALDQN